MPSTTQTQRVVELIASAEYAEAERAARRLVRRFARDGFGWKALAAALAAQGRWDEALRMYESAPPVALGEWEFQNNYGNALKMAGRLPEAVTQYERAIAAAPGVIEPRYNRGLALIDMGRLDEAELALKSVLAMDARHGLAHLNLADVLHVRGRLAEAEQHYPAALAVRGEDAKLHNNFGLLLRKRHRYTEAEAHYRRAIELDPRYATAYSNLADFMAEHGFLHEAVELLRVALEIEPGHAQAHSNLLFTLTHCEGVSMAELRAEHAAFVRVFEEPLRCEWRPHANTRDPERVLRIGFVSADLRNHPVVRYLRPALECMQKRADVRLIAYNNSPQQDAETMAYRALLAEWRDVAHMSDDALAEQVRADAVDVLVDLSGHTGHNRLCMFARKPAPVQVSWIGYPEMTGMAAMDYFVADRLLLPEGMEAEFAEKLLLLPAATCFEPCADAPVVSELPALRSGRFTFACLARANKVNRGTVRLWAAVLRAVPQARLMLAAMNDGKPPLRVVEWFAEEGIPGERLVFVHLRSVEQMLALHAGIDLCLETLPYNGSTSSNHSLWMGVPTLTLIGDRIPGRMGAALAMHVGIPEFVAASSEEYVAKAAGYAADPRGLAELRPKLRGMFAESALMQADVVVDALVEGLREAWRRWCDGLR